MCFIFLFFFLWLFLHFIWFFFSLKLGSDSTWLFLNSRSILSYYWGRCSSWQKTLFSRIKILPHKNLRLSLAGFLLSRWLTFIPSSRIYLMIFAGFGGHSQDIMCILKLCPEKHFFLLLFTSRWTPAFSSRGDAQLSKNSVTLFLPTQLERSLKSKSSKVSATHDCPPSPPSVRDCLTDSQTGWAASVETQNHAAKMGRDEVESLTVVICEAVERPFLFFWLFWTQKGGRERKRLH